MKKQERIKILENLQKQGLITPEEFAWEERPLPKARPRPKRAKPRRFQFSIDDFYNRFLPRWFVVGVGSFLLLIAVVSLIKAGLVLASFLMLLVGFLAIAVGFSGGYSALAAKTKVNYFINKYVVSIAGIIFAVLVIFLMIGRSEEFTLMTALAILALLGVIAAAVYNIFSKETWP